MTTRICPPCPRDEIDKWDQIWKQSWGGAFTPAQQAGGGAAAENQLLTNVAEIDITVTAESVLSGCTTTATKTETAPLRCSLDNQAGFALFFFPSSFPLSFIYVSNDFLLPWSCNPVNSGALWPSPPPRHCSACWSCWHLVWPGFLVGQVPSGS